MQYDDFDIFDDLDDFDDQDSQDNSDSQDNDELFELEALFAPEADDSNLTVDDDDYQPIGMGRKSQYAIHRTLPDDRIRSVVVDPEEELPAPRPRVRAAASSGKLPASHRPHGVSEPEQADDVSRVSTSEPEKEDYYIPQAARSGGFRETLAESRETAAEAIRIWADNAKEKKQARKEKYAKRPSGKKPASRRADKPAQRQTSQRAAGAVRGRNAPRTAGKTSGGGRASQTAAARRRPARKRSVGESLLSALYLCGAAVGGVFRTLFGSKRRIAVAAAIVGVFLLVWGISSAVTFYNSKTALADEGKNIDESAIITRKVTEAQNKDKVTYFLIVGVDKSSKLTDCVWVMCFDNEKHKMDVLQIPRDTYVGSDSIAPHKFNAVYESPKTVTWCEECNREVPDDEIEVSSGRHLNCGLKVGKKKESNMNALIRVVNNRLKLPVDHYVLFDFKGFEKVIDAMGGVDIVLEKEMRVYPNKKDYITLDAGLNHLDGSKALKFMRNRKIYANGDLGRVKAQRQLIHAIFEKVDGMSVVTAFNVLMAAKDYFKTDMSVDEITSFISPVKKCNTENLHMFELPGYSGMKNRTSYYFCDEEKAAELINEYMLPYSEKLTAEDIDFPDA